MWQIILFELMMIFLNMMLVKENVLAFGRCRLENLRVKCYGICDLLSNGLAKGSIHVYRKTRKKRDKMSTLDDYFRW